MAKRGIDISQHQGLIDLEALKPEIDKIEESIDAMRADLVNGHLERLKAGTCQPQSSGVFINLVNNLERAADHLTYISDSIE